MNKCIILSVQPQWLAKILNGEKTIEIRKSMPKCDYPIDVYLYCTKERPCLVDVRFLPYTTEPDFKIYPSEQVFGTSLNGKIVAKFTLNEVNKYISSSYSEKYSYYPYYRKITHKTGSEIKIHDVLNIQTRMCLSEKEFSDYGKGKPLYAWYIKNLQIFDKPMELRKFYKNGTYLLDDYVYNFYKGTGQDKYANYLLGRELRKPPQSWCYAYVEV